MKTRLPALVLAALAWLSCGGPPEQPDHRTNLVLIVGDDIGYADLSPYGSEIETPNLERLAHDGLRFTRFHVANMCVPTRASLLTGVYHHLALDEKRTLRPEAVTIAELLGQSGYSTYMAGKWHLSKPGNFDGLPLQRGFQHFYGTILGAASYFAPASLMRDNEDASADYQRPDFYYTDAISDAAAEFVRQAPENKPLFLYVAYTAAHWPLHAPEEEIAKHKGRYAEGWDKLRDARYERMKELGVIDPSWELSPRHPDVPPWSRVKNKEWQQRRMEVYAAQITRMDQGIGRILEALEVSGRLENTLILFLTDNGACHVEYAPDRKGPYLPETTRDGRPVRPGNLPEIMPGPEDTFQSYGYGWANAGNTPFRWFKQYDHEGGIHVPLIAYWPGEITKPGGLSREVSHVIDIAPTLLEVAGVRHPSRFEGRRVLRMDGKSLVPVLRGERRRGHDALFWKWNHGRAVRRDQWKLVAIDDGPWELYDIERDGTELHNVAEEHPQIVDALARLWRAWAALRPEDRIKP